MTFRIFEQKSFDNSIIFRQVKIYGVLLLLATTPFVITAVLAVFWRCCKLQATLVVGQRVCICVCLLVCNATYAAQLASHVVYRLFFCVCLLNNNVLLVLLSTWFGLSV